MASLTLGFRHSDDQPRSGDRIDFMCKAPDTAERRDAWLGDTGQKD